MAFSIQIDATQPTSSFFRIPNVTDNFVEGKDIRSFDLEPGTYAIVLSSSGSVFVTFQVTAEGTVLYEEAYNPVVTGRYSNTLKIIGFAVTLNASGLSNPRVKLYGSGSDFITQEPLRLAAGSYSLLLQSGGVTDFTFTVEQDGTFGYDPKFDVGQGGFLQGLGSNTLKLTGYPIKVDPRELAYHQFFIPGAMFDFEDSSSVRTLMLLPASYPFQTPERTQITFQVTQQGKVDFDTSLDACLKGRGTDQLSLPGFLVSFDARRFRHGIFVFATGTWVNQEQTMRMLPVSHQFQQSWGSGAFVNAVIGIDVNGRFSYDSALDVANGGFLGGLNTSRLEFVGYTLNIDTASLKGFKASINFREIDLDPAVPFQSVTLLPQENLTFTLETAPPQSAIFTVAQNGVISLKEASPFLVVDKVDGITVFRIVSIEEQHSMDGLIVRGNVEYEDGTPAAGVFVIAYDRDRGTIRNRLGDQEEGYPTDEAGRFPDIHYGSDQYSSGEGRSGPSADLVFEIVKPHVIQTSEISAIYRRLSLEDEIPVADLVLGIKARPVEDVRIVLVGRPKDAGVSEYARLMRDLGPVLMDEATPADLDQEKYHDFDFVVREIGWDRALIETMSLSWRRAGEASDEPERLAETFYGLLRDGSPTEVAALPNELSELLNRNASWQLKLEDSLHQLIIGDELATHLSRLRDWRATTRARAGNTDAPGVADILHLSGISEETRRDFLRLYQSFDGPIEDFWRKEVPQSLGWEEEKIREVQINLQFADFTGYHLPLISLLRKKGYSSMLDLTQLESNDWKKLVETAGLPPNSPGQDFDEQVARTVNSITGLINASFPNEIIARIAARSEDPELTQARQLLEGFFKTEFFQAGQEAKFDIRTTLVSNYLETHRERIFKGLEKSDQVLLQSQLQRLQRVYQLGINREQSQALLDLKLDSAYHIARSSPEFFVSRYASKLGGNEAAQMLYNRAEGISGTLQYLFTSLWQETQGVKPQIMRSIDESELISKLKQQPAYQALFGSIHMCACEECRSVFSPAAYFVDLLHMLDQPRHNSPYEILINRRPDLAHIQLTCENTNTLIPHIDLVNEILESFVANRTAVAFNQPPDRPGPSLPNPSTEELSVNPVYLTQDSTKFGDAAYAALKQSPFPLNLPLNLPLETTRTYLDYLGVSRAELMAVFETDPAFDVLMAHAAEILRLSPEEFQLLSGAEFSGEPVSRPVTTPEFFGLSAANTATDNPRLSFNHVAPEFSRNEPIPHRPALIRAVQNILGLITDIPPKVTGVFDQDTEEAVNAFLSQKGLPQHGRVDVDFWDAMALDKRPSLSVILCHVPFFLERSGLTYAELVALIRTHIFNPLLQVQSDLEYIDRLGLTSADLRTWIESGFKPLDHSILDKLTYFGENRNTFIEWVKARQHAIVLNSAFDSPCDIERTTLMHLDGTLLSEGELLALFRFIRLWRKLGWTIDEMDLALQPDSCRSDNMFGTVLLLANIKQLREKWHLSVEEIVCLWQNIPTYGASSPYDRLFSNRAAQWINPIFKLNSARNELYAATQTGPALLDYSAALLAAFRITAQELDLLLTRLKQDDGRLRPLNLYSLSVIYRHVSLARNLGLSIPELLALIGLSGFDPFDSPRMPQGTTIQFIEVATMVKKMGVNLLDLDYLCRPEPGSSNLHVAQSYAWRLTLGNLLEGLQSIAAEMTVDSDPTGELLRTRLSGVIGQENAQATVDLILGKAVYSLPLNDFPSDFEFPASVKGKTNYDSGRNILSFKGAMTEAERDDLLGVAGIPAAIKDSYEQAVKALAEQPRTLVTTSLQPLFQPSNEAIQELIEISSLQPDAAPDLDKIAQKINKLIARLQNWLSRSLVKQTFTSATGLPAELVSLVLEDSSVLQALIGDGPAIKDYLSLGGDGLSGIYVDGLERAEPIFMKRTDSKIAFASEGTQPWPAILIMTNTYPIPGLRRRTLRLSGV